MALSKDMQVAMTLQQMAAYGYLKEEFLLYSYVFQRDDQIVYKFSENAQSIHEAYQHSVFEDVYPTPIHSLLKNAVVPAGEHHVFKTRYKVELVQNLRELYGEPFFEAAALFKQTLPNDSAGALLETYMRTLEPQAEKRQLFDGLCKQALEAKVLSQAVYQKLMTSADRIYGKPLPVTAPIPGRGKRFSGFAYWSNSAAAPTYYFSATIEDTYSKYESMRQRGLLCSPIIQKNYLCTPNQFKTVRDEFQNYVKTLIADCQTLSHLQQIKALPAAVNPIHYQMFLDKLKEHATSEAYQTYLSYGYRFNLVN